LTCPLNKNGAFVPPYYCGALQGKRVEIDPEYAKRFCQKDFPACATYAAAVAASVQRASTDGKR
jgi:hypothetical protein